MDKEEFKKKLQDIFAILEQMHDDISFPEYKYWHKRNLDQATGLLYTIETDLFPLE